MLFAGMLLPLKGVYLAIKALALLPDWRLIICGSGPDEQRLRRLVRTENLSDRVEFRGWIGQNELARLMREQADVLVFPSLREQAGFVVAEATASGLPTVCLDRGGPRLLGGIAVRSGSPRATAGALAAAIVEARHVRPAPLPDRGHQLLRLRQILADHLAPGPLPSLPEDGDQPPDSVSRHA
jgi:glycosyltransferase involved in cell wall biosynthesis